MTAKPRNESDLVGQETEAQESTEQEDVLQTEVVSSTDGSKDLQAAEDDVSVEWNKGDVILDQYEVRGILGEGGMGRVYDIWHRGWNKRLAVKSPRPDYFKTERQKENFTREAETWMDLGLHPHAVSCFYVRTLGDIPRVFAECIEGGDLKGWIDSKKLYEGGPDESLKRILDIAIQFAWGLGFAHEKNLIHQDVKPANVMLTPEGVAKVTDFGLAKARGEAGESTEVGDGQSILASYGGMTPAYCSPEQANKETLTRRTDIWSWALSVLEMFIGEITWQSGIAAPGVLEEYLDGGTKVEGLSTMPKALAELLRQCFEFEEQNRPKDFGEVALQLLAVYHDAVGEEYSRPEPKAAELQADAFNNRGVSFWDLGKTEEAEAAFRDALKLNAEHVRATFNLGLLRWRGGRSTHTQLLMKLRDSCNTRPDDWEVPYLMGLVHLEYLEVQDAVHHLEVALKLGGQSEVEAALEQARRIGADDASESVRTFEGHTASVTSVDFNQDGRYCLSGSDDGTLRLWDASSGACVRIFKGHTAKVGAVAFSPEGRYCLSGSARGHLRLWEASSGTCVRKFGYHTSGVESVAFSPDGRFCLSSCEIGDYLELWNNSDGEFVERFRGHTGNVNSVAFSPDGHFFLSGSNDNTLRLWDASTGECARTFEGHTSSVLSVAFSPDGRFCLSGSFDDTLRLWDASSGECVRTFVGHTDGVTSANFSPDGHLCLSGSYDKTLRIWDATTGVCLQTFKGHDALILSVAFSPDGHLCLSGSSDETLRIWDASRDSGVKYEASAVLSEVRDSEEATQMDNEYSGLLAQARQANDRG